MSGQGTDKTAERPMGKAILAVKVVFFTVLLVSFAGLIYFSSIDRSSPLDYSDPVFIEEWTVTMPDGSVETGGRSFRNNGKKTGVFVVTSYLPDAITDDSYLCFIIGGDAQILINGELRADFDAARDMVIPGGCVKRFYMRIPLEPGDAGAKVTIIRKSLFRSGFVYQNTFVADSGAFFRFMMDRYGLSFILAALLLIFSSVIVIVSLIMAIIYRKRIEMFYGAMSVVVISAWLISNSFLYPFIFGHYHVDGVFNYMMALMLPFCLAFYLDALQHGRYRGIMRVILVVNAISLVVWPVLHLTGIFPFPSALIYIDGIQAVALFVVAGLLVLEVVRGLIKEYIYTAIGLSGFMLCGVGEIIVLNFLPIMNGDILMLAGLTFMLALTVVQQIVDLMKANEEGRRVVDLSEAKTRFLASMSHEIRTPINAILGMNEMILRENTDPVIADYAGSVKSSGQMLLMLVNDVLDFSKIEAGKMEINEAEFSFSSLLRNIMPMLTERADEKDLTLSTHIVNSVPDGQISDEFRLRQILINLINNAIKYTDAGFVSLTLDGEYETDDRYRLRMSVKDTGRGISEEDQKHLFEAFSRADTKKNRNIEGTGLGLAIVKNIVDPMNGTISVKSRYGEGSEFIVELPVRVTDRTPVEEDYDKHAEKTASAAGGDFYAPDACILAVDDNNSNLRIVKLFLKRVGIVPELCDSGTKAISMCRSKHYDLILLDHMMPDPDGIVTLKKIRSDPDSVNRDTPAIVLTANAVAGSREIYQEAGFADYLTKPIDSLLLEQTIREHLPAKKVLPGKEGAPAADSAPKEERKMSFREKLEMIDGLDYETALSHAGGDEELLKEMIAIICSECDEKIEKMKNDVASEDWKGYGLTAHSIKGLLASIGMDGLSKRARKHEYAADDLDISFIMSDHEDFLNTYRDVCGRLGDDLSDEQR